MESFLQLLIDNKIPIGGAAIAIIALWDKIKVAFVSLKSKIKIKLPVLPKAQPNDELADQEAIRHLRTRAVVFGDKELMSLIKEIDTRFYDIHTGVKNEK